MLSGYARNEWLTIIAIGLMTGLCFLLLGWWPLTLLAAVLTICGLLFYRDPERQIPTKRGVAVAPADGHISSIHDVEYFEPFGESAICIRIFLSVLDVHVNRTPVHGVVKSITHQSGQHLNAMNPDSAEVNESILMILEHPIKQHPIAAVRQVAGLLARTIVCAAKPNAVLQRGQRFGIIKLGSTTELYLPKSAKPQSLVQQGQRVWGGQTIIATLTPEITSEIAEAETNTDTNTSEKSIPKETSTTENAAKTPVQTMTPKAATLKAETKNQEAPLPKKTPAPQVSKESQTSTQAASLPNNEPNNEPAADSLFASYINHTSPNKKPNAS